MHVRDLSKQDETTLREIVRSVDKKLDYSLRDGAEAGDSNFTVHLSREGRQGDVTVRMEDLRAAHTDTVSRNKIRQRIKSSRDHMWDDRLVKDVLGTKAARMLKESGQPEPSSFRRPFNRRGPGR